MKRKLEQELISWKTRDHLPLLLRGARQVGKSYLIDHFGKNHFEEIVTIDFERRPEMKAVFSKREPQEILNQLEILLQKRVIPGKTLLFLDEIQECPEALISLRYFRELIPKLHVIAAGSLLEFLLNEDQYSFPVGRVEFLYLRPLSFEEFLEAAAPMIAESLRKIGLQTNKSAAEHEALLHWVRKYFFIGGMPAAIQAYLESNSFLESQRVHHRILSAYESDFGKYASLVQHKYLQMIFQRSPVLVGQILKYANINKEVRARDLRPALDLLTRSGLLGQIFATTASGVPLHAHLRDHRFKLQFLDVGLLQTACGVDAESFFSTQLLQINAGALAEQFIGQELLTIQAPYQNLPLLFWEKETGQAEVDFVTSVNSTIFPIEVKSGSTGTLRSLHRFLETKPYSPGGVRFSEQSLSLYENILSIPLYLTHIYPKLCKEAFGPLPRHSS